jgi:hypothetical protein
MPDDRDVVASRCLSLMKSMRVNVCVSEVGKVVVGVRRDFDSSGVDAAVCRICRL